MQKITEFTLLEVDKENIMPIPQGRSAKKLAELVHTDRQVLNEQLKSQRAEFEKMLDPTILQDLDDPLDLYLQYIKWIRENYKTGNTNESELIQVLERITHDFKDDDYYKNEIRYFKVWLEYITYSDHPGDVFNYLLKKKIGHNLSLFYEQYSLFFELNDQWGNAESILKLGISNNARPSKRLLKSYDDFIHRKESKKISINITTKGLTNPDGTGLFEHTGNKKKQERIPIFQDSEVIGKGHFFHNYGDDDILGLDSFKNSKKENVLQPMAWNGQVLKDSSSKKNSELDLNRKENKIEVFNDKSMLYPITKTIKHSDGKRLETFDFNFDLFMPNSSPENPMSMIEVLLMFQPPIVSEPSQSKSAEYTKRTFDSNELLFNTPRNKKLKTEPISTSKSIDNSYGIADTPLLEYFKNSNNGPFSAEDENAINADDKQDNYKENRAENIFESLIENDIITENHFIKSKKKENENPQRLETNNLLDAIMDGAFSDVLTETITKQLDPKTPTYEKQDKGVEDNYEIEDDAELLSSPFLENPNENILEFPTGNNMVVNPFDFQLKNKFLERIKKSLFQSNNFYNFGSTQMNKLDILHSIFKSNGSPIFGNKQAMIDFGHDELYCVTKELGRGGFATVYLSEKMDGQLNAIKVESPSNIWEAYILNKLNRKSNCFIEVKSLYAYDDETFLILPYLKQGTILDLVNSLSNYHFLTGKNLIEESLVIYFTIQLINNVLKLHSNKIIHCDIKPENCMLNINTSDYKLTFDDLILIDYGRSIDLSLFPLNTRFKTKFDKTDSQDCPEFVKNSVWCYEPDYYGVANIVHTLLFNKVIKIRENSEGIQLLESFKRYWQRELWQELFDIILNPKKYNPSGDVREDLIKVKSKLESWFNLVVDKRLFLEKLREISEILETRIKNKKA